MPCIKLFPQTQGGQRLKRTFCEIPRCILWFATSSYSAQFLVVENNISLYSNQSYLLTMDWFSRQCRIITGCVFLVYFVMRGVILNVWGIMIMYCLIVAL